MQGKKEVCATIPKKGRICSRKKEKDIRTYANVHKVCTVYVIFLK